MKKIIMVICLQLVSTMLLNAQNNIWSLPPNYYQFPFGPPQPLPAPGDGYYLGSGVPNDPNDPLDGYDGLPAQYSHNAMQDAGGNILFFIVDDVVYDKNGYSFGVLNPNILYYANPYVSLFFFIFVIKT